MLPDDNIAVSTCGTLSREKYRAVETYVLKLLGTVCQTPFYSVYRAFVLLSFAVSLQHLAYSSQIIGLAALLPNLQLFMEFFNVLLDIKHKHVDILA